MTTIEIDRIRARYHDVDPDGLTVLDGALRDLADDVLEDELAAVDLGGGLLSTAVGRAYAICIDELSVAVDFDPTGSRRAVAGSWAGAILDALRRRIDAGPDGFDDVVVYQREVDAVVDLVTSVASGDRRRVWAWHQIGLVPPSVAWPTPVHVADTLTARPSMIPAVMAVAGPAARALLGPAEYVRIARALEPIVPSPPRPDVTVQSVPEPPASADRRADPVAALGGASPQRTAVVPADIWTAVADARDRWALAVLTLAVTRPHLVGDPAAIAAVVRQIDASHLGDDVSSDERTSTVESVPSPVDADAEDPPASDAVGDAQRAVSDHDTETGTDEPAGTDVASPWGGVWFLLHPYRTLDLPAGLRTGPLGAVDAVDALTAITVAVTSAPTDDPSVRGLVGRQEDDPAEPWMPATAAEREEVERWAEVVRGWVTDRAHGRLDDLDPVWRRNVSIAATPGWMEVTFSLDDVDLGVRMAGLDLDPGFVWWLGAVVGFRYV